MKRLGKSGASLSTPLLDEARLKVALDKLGVGEKFNDKAVGAVYSKISAVIGAWHDEQLRASEASPTARALFSTAQNLEEASKLFSGRQTGLRTSVETYVINETIRLLELDPTVQDAKGIVEAFRELAIKIAHVCMVAHAALMEKGQNGRPQLGWYDDFTELLFELAKRGGVKPSLGRDGVDGHRTGWLLKAAQALEPFLERDMRSNSEEACASRLERSKRRLCAKKRQNPPRR